MDKLFLRIVALFHPLLQKAGVDTEQLQSILRVKLMMDRRRPSPMFTKRKQNNTSAASPWFVDFFMVLIGFFMSLILLNFDEMPLLAQTCYFSIFMVLMALTLISDFTTVLLDVRDQFIIMPRPVNDRTMAVSRILHITIYVMRLAVLQGLPGVIVAGFADKSVFASLLFMLQVIEATLLCILIVNLVYLALMRSVSPQKFKDIISYFQIGFSVLIFAVYYLLPRLIDLTVLKHINVMEHWWSYILPPVWIAALNEVLIHPGRANLFTSLLAIAGVVFPLIGLWLVAVVLAPGFNRKLVQLATSDGNTSTVAPGAATKAYRIDFRDRLAGWLCKDPVENAGFRITWKLAARTREFKMKAFPAFAYVPIYFIYFAFSGKSHNDGVSKLSHLQHSSYYVFFIYLSTIVLSSMLQNISNSEKYKASWVYYALPVNQPGKILSGMYKAIVSIYFFPYCLILGSVISIIWGPQVINDVILAFLLCLTYGILLALFMVKGLPFSKPVSVKQSGGRFVSSILILFFIGGLGFGHYLLARWETVIWILIIPAAALVWIMLHYYRKQTWDAIEAEEL